MAIVTGNIQSIEKAIADKQSFVIKFFATWCGPCKMYAPIYDMVAMQESISMFSIDIDEYPEFTNTWNVSSVPTTLFFKKGKLEERRLGFLTEQDLSSLIKKIK